MSGVLLDVNVLLALAWPRHLHYEPAHRWFRENQRPWATCTLTQAAFLRLSCQPAVTGSAVSFRDAMRLLDQALRHPRHEYWGESGPLEVPAGIRDRVFGHQQVTDALLLAMAVQRGGKLATFDRRVENLAGKDAAVRSAIEVIAL